MKVAACFLLLLSLAICSLRFLAKHDMPANAVIRAKDLPTTGNPTIPGDGTPPRICQDVVGEAIDAAIKSGATRGEIITAGFGPGPGSQGDPCPALLIERDKDHPRRDDSLKK